MVNRATISRNFGNNPNLQLHVNIVFMDEIIGTLKWRINDEAEGRIR